MNKKYQKEVIDLLRASAKDPELFSDVLSDLLTPSEYEEFSLRWQIVKRIASGEPQRSIAKDLGVGIATVTRGSRTLSRKNGGFAKVLKRKK